MTTLRKWLLLASDAAVFYVSLALTLLVRYGSSGWSDAWGAHVGPFAPIFCIWILSIYTTNLYRYESFRNARLLMRNLGGAIVGATVVSVAAFYVFAPLFELTPKTNLAVFALVFFILASVVRTFAGRMFSGTALRVVLLGKSSVADEVASFLTENQGAGYHISRRAEQPFVDRAALEAFVRIERPEMIVVEEGWIADPKVLGALYELLGKNVRIIPLIRFYETVFEKVPIGELGESWFVLNISPNRPVYALAQRSFDIVTAVVLGIVLLPVALLAAIAIVSTSAGPAIYAQVRVGKNGSRFTIYKFRTMRNDAEKHGPRYAVANDERLTTVGRVLRHTHLDELPQLWNIFRGNLSFVGPRPERPEFTEEIATQVPFFHVRNLVKPGLTGWAQVNYRYTASVEEAKEKLAYDVFYIKNRSILFDVLIMVKTVKRILVKA